MSLPLDPNKELLRWGPIPGRFFYTSMFVEINMHFCEKFIGRQWPETLFLMKDGKMIWLNEYDALRRNGLEVMKRYMLPCEKRRDIYRDWKKYIKQLTKIEDGITTKRLGKLNNGALFKLYDQFNQVYLKFWANGTVPELSNYGSDKYFFKQLGKYIKDSAELSNAIEKLTAPTRLSFYQEEELDLVETRNISVHQQKYFWLKNSYAGTQVLPVKYFIDRKKKLKNVSRQSCNAYFTKIKKDKISLQKKYHLPKELMNLANAISEGIAWQDERKKNIFIALQYQDIFLDEVIRRFGYTKSDLLNAWYWEVGEIMQGIDYRDELKKRRVAMGAQFYKKYRQLDFAEVKRLWSIYVDEKVDKSIKEVSGLVVSKGKKNVVRGKVHILLDPNKTASFKKGEILVAPMTSPEYIFAMKKSLAVVTDAGGLTSHAAIVSRELGIPCIVGTKIATKVFKNGDTLEINTINGVVKKYDQKK